MRAGNMTGKDLENSKEACVSTSFKMPVSLNQKLNEKVVADGYGMRGKSRWVKEAILQLFEIQDYQVLVSLSEEVQQLSSPATIRIPRSLMLSIENAIISVRKKDPALEGVKSKIIRTAIIQRMIRV